MTIKLYWWQGEGATDSAKQNFGDYLSPLIVEMVSGKKVVYAEPKKADMIAIGSILSRERKAKGILLKRHLHIWGSGTDRSSRIFSGHHTYHAVRGKITQSQIYKARQNPALGDPGLLVDQFYDGKAKPDKQFRLGIIPHFVDQKDPRITALASLERTKVIDVFSPAKQVVNEILQCEFILSSSMHGLIISDSFGIPNRRLLLSSGIISDLKFEDYYSAFGLAAPAPIIPESIISERWNHSFFAESHERPGIDAIKSGLISSFPDI